MSTAQLLSQLPSSSSDAVSMVEDATISDLGFLIRQRSKSSLADTDVRFLAEILLHALRDGATISQKSVEKMLIDRGRSPRKASELSRAILK